METASKPRKQKAKIPVKPGKTDTARLIAILTSNGSSPREVRKRVSTSPAKFSQMAQGKLDATPEQLRELRVLVKAGKPLLYVAPKGDPKRKPKAVRATRKAARKTVGVPVDKLNALENASSGLQEAINSMAVGPSESIQVKLYNDGRVEARVYQGASAQMVYAVASLATLGHTVTITPVGAV